jgi:Cu/Ag efflux protein CusF
MEFIVGIRSIVLGLVLALAACSPPAPTAEQTQPAGPVRSSGVVVALTPEYRAITIRHAPIPEYQMGEMTMEFTVDDAAKLQGIEVGDNVSFELSGPIDISSISVTEAN